MTKTLEPQVEEKKPRSGVKTSGVATLVNSDMLGKSSGLIGPPQWCKETRWLANYIICSFFARPGVEYVHDRITFALLSKYDFENMAGSCGVNTLVRVCVLVFDTFA